MAQELEAAACSDGGYSCFDGCRAAVENIISKLFNYAIRFSCCPISSPLHPGAPFRSAPAALDGVGAGRRFNGASLMHGYPAVQECGMEVVFVRCRQRSKYINYEILCCKER